MLAKTIYKNTKRLTLQMLIDKFNHYFPGSTEEAKIGQNLILNPFSTDARIVTEEILEELIDLQKDRNCKVALSNSLKTFRCKKQNS